MIDSYPRMMTVRQKFDAPRIEDLPGHINLQLDRMRGAVKPGMRVAVGVGSRGISRIDEMVKLVLAFLREAGAEPFVVPAMGSHGGATEEGQVQLLADYGVSEDRLGVPVRASLDVEQLGTTAGGFPVLFSKEALSADGVVIINRIKPHTDFEGTIGSGLMKMLVVGLGKRLGAANYHTKASRLGYETVLRESARIILDKAPVLFGVAIVENQLHNPARVEMLTPARIEEGESELFKEASLLLPGLPLDDIDLLIVDQLGKNLSGSGMDPNVIGRGVHGYRSSVTGGGEGPLIRRLFVRGLTAESHGNAIGVGMADFTTSRLVKQMNREITTINALTAMTIQSAKVPVYFDTDREAVDRALNSVGITDGRGARVMRIASTLALESVEVSEPFLAEAEKKSNLEVLGEAREMTFDDAGNLHELGVT